jgi:hypothetical protein
LGLALQCEEEELLRFAVATLGVGDDAESMSDRGALRFLFAQFFIDLASFVPLPAALEVAASSELHSHGRRRHAAVRLRLQAADLFVFGDRRGRRGQAGLLGEPFAAGHVGTASGAGGHAEKNQPPPIEREVPSHC